MQKKLVVVGMSALFGCLPVACGAESDVLAHRPGTGGTGGSSGNSGAHAGGKSAGASGDSSFDGGIGPSAGGSGNTQAGSGATSGSGPNGGKGGAITGGASSSPGGASSYDPRADQKKTLVDGLCGLLKDYPCLRYGVIGSTSTDATYCSQFERIAAADVLPECFDVWANEMRCLTRVQAQCPCSDIDRDCRLQAPGGQSPYPCPTEEQAFSDCTAAHPLPHGTVEGTAETCHWELDQQGRCDAYCDARPNKHTFSVDCALGAPGGPQYCYCYVDGTRLVDGTPDDATLGGALTGDDCADIAQKMADGQCNKILNCCFTWKGQGETVADQCSCLSDPKIKGLSTCAEVAALGGGKIVDICPQNAPPPNFPVPDGSM